MKKKLFFLAVAAVALASCSNDETIASQANNEANEISFRTFVGGQTRSTDITQSTIQTSGFKVYATLNNSSTVYFDETDFTYSNGFWTSANKYYWPSTGALDFYAYASNGSSTISHEGQTKAFTITPATAATNQSDFVFANTNNKSKGSSADNSTFYGKNGVPLNFRHALSKVTIKMMNSNPNIKVIIKDVTIGNVKNKGTYTYSGSTTNTNTDATNTENLKYGDWGWGDASNTYYAQTATTTEYTSATAATALPTPYILVPQTLVSATKYSEASASSTFGGAYIKAQIKIQNAKNSAYIVGADGDNYVTALWPLQANQWNPGYHYIYTVDLAGGGYYETNQDADDDLDPILENAEIKFITCSVDSWDESDTGVLSNMTFAKGGTYNVDIPVNAGTYYITITGLTASNAMTVTGTNGCTSPTVTTPVGSTGTATVTCNVSAAASTTTSVITITEGSTVSTTVINLKQTVVTP